MLPKPKRLGIFAGLLVGADTCGPLPSLGGLRWPLTRPLRPVSSVVILNLSVAQLIG
jgi:hypothetical protein